MCRYRAAWRSCCAIITHAHTEIVARLVDLILQVEYITIIEVVHKLEELGDRGHKLQRLARKHSAMRRVLDGLGRLVAHLVKVCLVGNTEKRRQVEVKVVCVGTLVRSRPVNAARPLGRLDVHLRLQRVDFLDKRLGIQILKVVHEGSQMCNRLEHVLH
jgi:hypothetical protein